MLLLASGANVNSPARHLYVEGVYQTDSPFRNWTPLHCAAARGHKHVAVLLIAGGADVNAENAYDSTPLEFASAGGNKDLVQLLLEKGARVNRREGVLGKSALQCAKDNGHDEIVVMLRQHGDKD
jgi:ankyrin repeat protein